MTKKKENPTSFIGNTYALKMKSPEIRQEAYRQYCAHIASGMPKQAFFFDHPELTLCWKTIEKHIEENPEEFPAVKMEMAKAKRYQHWLSEGQKILRGEYKGGSPVVWQTVMRNIFREIGWDQEERKQDSNLEDFNRLVEFFNKVTNQIPNKTQIAVAIRKDPQQLESVEEVPAFAPPQSQPSMPPQEPASAQQAASLNSSRPVSRGQQSVPRPSDFQSQSPPLPSFHRKSSF